MFFWGVYKIKRILSQFMTLGCYKVDFELIWPNYSAILLQGAYNSGKPGILRELSKSVKVRENSDNLELSQGIFQFSCRDKYST